MIYQEKSHNMYEDSISQVKFAEMVTQNLTQCQQANNSNLQQIRNNILYQTYSEGASPRRRVNRIMNRSFKKITKERQQKRVQMLELKVKKLQKEILILKKKNKKILASKGNTMQIFIQGQEQGLPFSEKQQMCQILQESTHLTLSNFVSEILEKNSRTMIHWQNQIKESFNKNIVSFLMQCQHLMIPPSSHKFFNFNKQNLINDFETKLPAIFNQTNTSQKNKKMVYCFRRIIRDEYQKYQDLVKLICNLHEKLLENAKYLQNVLNTYKKFLLQSAMNSSLNHNKILNQQ